MSKPGLVDISVARRQDRAPVDADLLFSRVMTEPNSGCWIWLGPNRNGYGTLFADGKVKKATRVSWSIHKGPIPDDLWALHKCDNPICINPDHLFLGNAFDNMADCSAKGRNAMQRRRHRSAFNRTDIPRPHGEKHGMSKLTEADVFLAHEMHWSGSTTYEIADAISVSEPHVRKLLAGKAWSRTHAAAIRARGSEND